MKNYCLLQITAGQGPEECALAVNLLAKKIIKEAQNQNLQAELIEAIAGNKPNTFISVLISLQGNNIDNFIKNRSGTIRWICQSPFRPRHKRKNWFVGVDIITPVSSENDDLDEKNVEFTTMRATGPGGQHINKTESAVRATHKATGLTVIAREERSQLMNKKLALAKLALQINEIKQQKIVQNKQGKRIKHYKLERGNPVRTFEGLDMKERL